MDPVTERELREKIERLEGELFGVNVEVENLRKRRQDLVAEVDLWKLADSQAVKALTREAAALHETISAQAKTVKALKEDLDLLQRERRGFDDLKAAVSRSLKDAHLRSVARLTIDNEGLRVRYEACVKERDELANQLEAIKMAGKSKA